MAGTPGESSSTVWWVSMEDASCSSGTTSWRRVPWQLPTAPLLPHPKGLGDDKYTRKGAGEHARPRTGGCHNPGAAPRASTSRLTVPAVTPPHRAPPCAPHGGHRTLRPDRTRLAPARGQPEHHPGADSAFGQDPHPQDPAPQRSQNRSGAVTRTRPRRPPPTRPACLTSPHLRTHRPASAAMRMRAAGTLPPPPLWSRPWAARRNGGAAGTRWRWEELRSARPAGAGRAVVGWGCHLLQNKQSNKQTNPRLV